MKKGFPYLLYASEHGDDMTPGNTLAAMRDKRPLVQCITNYVAMNFAANVLLASGASPAMVHAEEEAADFTAMCSALTVNIGTLSSPWIRGMHAAADSAGNHGIPWVLDPVAHFISSFRGEAVRSLLERQPTIVRGNASEIMSLAGQSAAGQGVDSGDSVQAAHQAATELARQYDTVVAITGAVDFVTDGTRHAQVSGGSDMMPQVTAMGCSLTALSGAFAAVATPFDAVLAALAQFKAAGQIAEDNSSGPGSFQVAFLDALANVEPAALDDIKLS